MMVGMKTALDTSDDTEAICLFYQAAEGVMCAGLRYNGSSIVSYGEWIKAGIFSVSAASNSKINELGVDQSDLWFPQGLDGTTTYTADGTDDSFWSVFKFQPLESTSGYTDDWRFSPNDLEVIPYVYKYDATADTAAYYQGTTFAIKAATRLVLSSTFGTIGALVGAMFMITA